MTREISFRTVYGPAEKEIIIKKSRFICNVSPVESQEEAQDFVEQIRKKYWDATHNVPAWRVGYPVPAERFSDDGEPAGTAGIPVLEVLRKQGLTNCAVVVTRYFGGILLGAGGLVRAYTDSAAQGLSEAGVKKFRMHRCFKFTLVYSQLGPVMHLLQNLGARVAPPEFGSEVMVSGWILPERAAELQQAVAEASQGQIEVEWCGEDFIDELKK